MCWAPEGKNNFFSKYSGADPFGKSHKVPHPAGPEAAGEAVPVDHLGERGGSSDSGRVPRATVHFSPWSCPGCQQCSEQSDGSTEHRVEQGGSMETVYASGLPIVSLPDCRPDFLVKLIIPPCHRFPSSFFFRSLMCNIWLTPSLIAFMFAPHWCGRRSHCGDACLLHLLLACCHNRMLNTAPVAESPQLNAAVSLGSSGYLFTVSSQLFIERRLMWFKDRMWTQFLSHMLTCFFFI